VPLARALGSSRLAQARTQGLHVSPRSSFELSFVAPAKPRLLSTSLKTGNGDASRIGLQLSCPTFKTIAPVGMPGIFQFIR
jgi:hypothetical protein